MNQSRHHHRDDIHVEHDLEIGILGRAREWTDVLPWLRYLRVLRLVASPTALLVVTLTMVIWLQLAHLLLDGHGRSHVIKESTNLVDQGITEEGAALEQMPGVVFEHLHQISPTVIWEHLDWWDRNNLDSPWKLVVLMIASTMIWMPAILFLLRQGATLTAGRTMLRFTQVVRLVFRRGLQGWLVGILPAVVVAMGILFLYVVSLIGHVVDGIGFLEAILALMMAFVALLIGMVGFGAQFAVPLAWSAIVNESDADIMDSLSRGYEYFLRRPIHLLFNLFVVIVIVGILAMLASALSEFSLTTTSIAFRHAEAPGTLQAKFAVVVGFLPVVVMITLFWGLMGGVYLLLRQSAGGQEVEDLWIPATSAPDPLPKRT